MESWEETKDEDETGKARRRAVKGTTTAWPRWKSSGGMEASCLGIWRGRTKDMETLTWKDVLLSWLEGRFR